MLHQNQSRETTFGYLSTVQTAEHGYFGGYLVVSALGRPLEFHCTSPVRPSRAQEILYGPTLKPYLLGEQIAGTLLRAAKLTPRLLLTDQPAMLAVRPQATMAMALVRSLTEQGRAAVLNDACGGGKQTASLEPCGDPFMVGAHQVQLAPGFESERQVVIESLELMTDALDLSEPFGRIHEAILEAQRIGGRMLVEHAQAA